MPAENRFTGYSKSITASAIGAFAITPDDAADLPYTIRQITIGTDGGEISYVYRGETWTTGPLPVGTYPMMADRILATGTTATGLTGWL